MELHTRLTEEAMTFDDYLLALFYLIDSELEAMNLPRLRRRGPDPTLHDSEVITIELAGEFLGIDTDAGVFAHFRRYHRGEFPALAHVDRTTFARQSAKLWRVKQLLHARVLERLPAGEGADGGGPLWVLDSFPLRVCRFRRAPAHRSFAGRGTAYGRDPTDGGRDGRFFGFRVHLRVSDRGFCCAATLAPGNVSDVPLVAELVPPAGGVGVGDRNYWNPDAQRWLDAHRGFVLLAPFRKKKYDPWPRRAKLIGRLRQVIEPVIGQLAVRFNCQRTWARDLWHLCVRVGRKLLSHTAAALLNLRQGNPPLRLNLLLRD